MDYELLEKYCQLNFKGVKREIAEFIFGTYGRSNYARRGLFALCQDNDEFEFKAGNDTEIRAGTIEHLLVTQNEVLEKMLIRMDKK